VSGLLALPRVHFLAAELAAAQRTGDRQRASNVRSALKKIFFERQGELFELTRFPRLRAAADFAAVLPTSSFGFTGGLAGGLARGFASGRLRRERQRRLAGFLHHQCAPIHTSLTLLDKDARADAVAGFGCILCFCGEAHASGASAVKPLLKPMIAVQELLSRALLGGRELQAELYLQLMKQLSRCAHPP
jgi:hypothetical protein